MKSYTCCSCGKLNRALGIDPVRPSLSINLYIHHRINVSNIVLQVSKSILHWIILRKLTRYSEMSMLRTILVLVSLWSYCCLGSCSDKEMEILNTRRKKIINLNLWYVCLTNNLAELHYWDLAPSHSEGYLLSSFNNQTNIICNQFEAPWYTLICCQYSVVTYRSVRLRRLPRFLGTEHWTGYYLAGWHEKRK